LISASSSARRGAPAPPPPQRLLHARGFQRVQYWAGHVFVQQAGLDRDAAAAGQALHARVRIRAVLREAPVVLAAAALGAPGDAGQQVRRDVHHVLAAGRVTQQLDQPLVGVHVDDRGPFRRRVCLALPLQ
jgi:hypothetical protein